MRRVYSHRDYLSRLFYHDSEDERNKPRRILLRMEQGSALVGHWYSIHNMVPFGFIHHHPGLFENRSTNFMVSSIPSWMSKEFLLEK